MSRRSKSDLAEGIATRLRDLRGRAGLTQQDVAERAGLSPETVSRCEKGVFAPELTTLLALARALGCSLGELVDLGSPTPELGDLDAEERELVQRWRRLRPGVRSAVLRLMAEVERSPT
ncbi:MAG: helix-turn-helix domain-containing protein [Pseudomonadota bacterium]|nr:helix-turn-helix domain-containing protein [Pseudomonadota bacterium]